MLKSRSRLLLMKLHAYFACFFLPLTVVYVVSGVLYLFDIKGGVAHEVHYPVPLANGWLEDEAEARNLVLAQLQDKDHPRLPPDYYLEPGGVHDWYGYQQEVILAPTDDPAMAELVVKEHDFLHQLLLIHKGHAGDVFWLLAIFLGLSLSFSMLSGVVISVNLPKLKWPSLGWLAAGVVVLVWVFL